MVRGKKHSPEQIVSLLRQVEVAVAMEDALAQINADHVISIRHPP